MYYSDIKEFSGNLKRYLELALLSYIFILLKFILFYTSL